VDYSKINQRRKNTTMSHQSKISTDFKDPEMLKAAAESLGCKMEKASSYEGYSGRRHKCNWRILVPGGRDVGVIEKDGALSLSTDWYGRTGRKVAETMGENFDILKREYAVRKAIQNTSWDGWTVVEKKTVTIEETVHAGN